MLQCNNIYKKLEKTNRLIANNISFNIENGQIFTILGESGAGKTTFLRMIAGFNNPDHGEIIINDNTVFKKGISVEPNKRDVGIIFQHNSLFPHMNTYENIEFAIANYSKAQKKLIIDNIVIKLNLFNILHKYPNQLSGGEQQKVVLARILCKSNKVLLMDEPFNALDKAYREEMRLLIKDVVRKNNLMAILVTHDQEEAFSISDKMAILKDGVFVQNDTPYNIYNYPINDYVAKTTGKYNIISVMQHAKLFNINLNNTVNTVKNNILIRPENIKIFLSNINKSLPAKVIDITYFGFYYLININVFGVILQVIVDKPYFGVNDNVFIEIQDFLLL